MEILAGGRLRANPAYELVLLDRLGAAERELVGEVDDADVYGVLRPRPGASLEARAVSPDTALLFLTLVEGGRLPDYVRTQLGAELDHAIGRLVLDGVLELLHDGKYVSATAAAPLLLPERSEGGRGRIGELSKAALRYAQELGPLDESLLAMRLYLYGCIPVSPALRDRWPDEDAVSAHLGLRRGGDARAALAKGWAEGDEENTSPHWRYWYPRLAAAAPAPKGANCKLYVSPGVDALPEALVAVAETLRGAPGLSAFKIGRDVFGICRADKLVAYFDRLDDLRRAADRLRERLPAADPQGVPFTAAISHDGLLSWGADPPRPRSPRRSVSWRLWVAERLAGYITQGRRSERGGIEPWQFALERLRLAGIDTDTWAPTGGMWPKVEAGA